MKEICKEEDWCVNTAKYKVGHPVCAIHLVKAVRRVLDLTRVINGEGRAEVSGI